MGSATINCRPNREKRTRSWLIPAKVWVLAMFLIPVVPKLQVFSVAGLPILLDDAVLLAGVSLAILALFLDLSVMAVSKIKVSLVAGFFATLLLYKFVDLGLLSLFLPWGGLLVIGKGVYIQEGILVLGKGFCYLVVYMVMYSLAVDRVQVGSILRYFIFTVSIVVCYSLVQFFILDHNVLTSTFRNIYVMSQVVPGVWYFEDPWFSPGAVGHEHLGAYMIVALSILGGVLVYGWPVSRVRRWTFALLWLVCIFNLVFSSSRGAWIGGLCGFATLALILICSGGGFIVVRTILGLCFVTLIVHWFTDVHIYEYIEGRIKNLVGMMYGDSIDHSAKDRISLYGNLWMIFQEFPILGLGPGGAGRIAESQFMRELIEGGIIGAMIFLAMMAKCASITLRLHKIAVDRISKGLGLGLFCTMAGLAGQCFFTDLLILTKIAVPFWLLVAVVNKLYSLESQKLALSTDVSYTIR